MNVNLTPEECANAKQIFEKYQEICDRKKEIAEEEKGAKADMAKLIDGSAGDAGKVLKVMESLYEDGTNPFDDICSVVEVIQHNGQ